MLSTAGLVCIPVSASLAESTPQRIQRPSVVPAVGQQKPANIVQVGAATEPRRLGDQSGARLAVDRSVSPSGANGVQQVAAAAGTNQNSEVQKKLEELYRKNGREMPPMAMEQLPEQNLKQKVPPLPKQATTATPTSQPAVAQSRFGGLFKNINPFKRSENDERPRHVESMPADVARQQQAVQAQGSQPQYRNYQQPQPQQQAQPQPQRLAPPQQQAGSKFVPPAPALPPAAPAAEPPQFTAPGLLSPNSGAIGRAINSNTPAPADLPEFKPAVQLPQDAKLVTKPAALSPATPAAAPKSTELPALSGELSDAPFGAEEVEAKKPAANAAPASGDDLDNAFPELSETDADKGKAKAAAPKAAPKLPELKSEPAEDAKDENPFTGLKLEATEAAKEAVKETAKPALQAIENAPKLPEALKLPLSLPEPGKLAADDDDDDDDDDEEEMTSAKPEPQLDPAAKMKKIADRKDAKGFKGFCPVALRDGRDLVDSKPQFKATYLGKVYNFSSEDAREKFTKNPKLYAPVLLGRDTVALKDSAEDIEGKLDHAAWFKDRLYLFNSAKTKDKFELQPAKYVVEE